MNEAVFERIAAIAFLAAILVGSYHRIRAHRPDEKISRKEEGKLIWFRLVLFPFLIGLILHISKPEAMQWSTVKLPNGLRWLGAAVTITCIPLLYWVFHSLGKNITDTVVTRTEHTLVTKGPYRWVRHPFYTTVILSWIGLSLLLASWLFPVLMAVFVLYLILRTPMEEANLSKRFGEDYRAYMQRTGSFLPRLRR